jgi:hypothetical protein
MIMVSALTDKIDLIELVLKAISEERQYRMLALLYFAAKRPYTSRT